MLLGDWSSHVGRDTSSEKSAAWQPDPNKKMVENNTQTARIQAPSPRNYLGEKASVPLISG
jgi:hypothetical protein